MKYGSRIFSKADIKCIQNHAREPHISRRELSRRVCEDLDWYTPDGNLKDMACRVVLLRMQKDGLVELQPVKPRANNRYPIKHTENTAPQSPITCPVGQLHNIHLEPVTTKECSRLWNEYIDRYHYLGYKTLPGAQMRYFAYSDERLLGMFGFGAAAWTVAPRDKFIGWSHSQREAKLHLIVNNARFLILPWIKSQHLASKLLALAIKRLSNDWDNRYGYRPVLLETFVEKQKFSGTCYRASNWTCLGDTQGYGRHSGATAHALPIKSIWVFPLSSNFREILNNREK